MREIMVFNLETLFLSYFLSFHELKFFRMSAQNTIGLVDEQVELRNRELTQEYLNFLDDSVRLSISGS